MPALTATETFGPENNPTVQVTLPRILETSQWTFSLAVATPTLTLDMHR